ncbi:MAG TPA: serine/threonine-protein kinase [Thermoanaerobaculia bacterium]|nr:serine/threonine-protein kinase [Thermoanaerobaculia bacterium]
MRDETGTVTRRIGRYRLLREIGGGAAASVYLAEDEKGGRKVALKLLHPELTGNADQVRRFCQEAEWCSLLNHPNIVAIYELGEDRGRHFMAVEYVEGRSLRQLLPPEMPPLEATRIAIGVGSALIAAHEAWIVHRDIKPDNVMIRPDGCVKVLDFGLAKLTQPKGKVTSVTRPGQIVGTLEYLAPEQILGEGADPRTDLFSLGVVYYETLAGRPPFAAATNRELLRTILRRDPPPLSSELPEKARRIAARALEKDVDMRYQSATAFVAELMALERELA